jgi:AraC-like DNA-binding protein
MNAMPTAQQSGFKQGECQVVSHRTRSWRLAKADIVERKGLAKEETAVVSDRHLILLNLRGASVNGQFSLDDRRVAFIRRKPGAILFIPAGCEWRGWESGASNASYLAIAVEPALVTTLCMERAVGKPPPLSPDLGFEDPIIMNAARGIAREIDDQNPVSTMLTESYIGAIFAQLVRKQRFIAPTRKGGLTSSHLTRIIECIDQDLTAELSLSQLAEKIGFSVPHFCRAFRQSVGCPPHTFIVRRRLAQAQNLLRETQLSLTDIALSCGFASSSHFSNAFRRLIGTTPLSYRQNWQVRTMDDAEAPSQ